MNDQAITATQMVWQPPLIRLTQIINPGLDGDVPTVCFVAPHLIIQISRATAFFKQKSTMAAGIPDPDGVLMPELGKVDCTLVVVHGGGLHVTESPEEIARLRDQSLGYEQKLKAV